jgi:hypothetical protein
VWHDAQDGQARTRSGWSPVGSSHANRRPATRQVCIGLPLMDTDPTPGVAADEQVGARARGGRDIAVDVLQVNAFDQVRGVRIADINQPPRRGRC